MVSSRSPGANRPEEEAAAWYAGRSIGNVGPKDQVAFDAWIAADAVHGRAYARLEALMGSLSTLDVHPDVRVLRAQAASLARAHRRNRMSLRIAGIGGLAAAMALAAFFVSWPFSTERMTMETGAGEIRRAVFSDGTQAWLGSHTRIELEYARNRRAIRVRRGEAFFDVAKNKRRPFVVSAGERSVTALGTAFDVRVFEADFIVTLLRGSVSIRRALSDGEKETRLQSGQQYWLNGDVAVVRDVDAEAQVSWHDGLIKLDDTSLGEAVATFNHNSKIRLLISDDRLSALRVSGTFHAGSAWDFARALQVEHPVLAVRQPSGDILLKYR
jgi:transmembrane sensor